MQPSPDPTHRLIAISRIESAEQRNPESRGCRTRSGVRDGFPICNQHRWGEILTQEHPEPPVGSVVVPADGLAHVRIIDGWTEYEHASEPISWERMLSYESAVRLVHWSPTGGTARQPCRPQEHDFL
jgi:hypothetical protein